MRKCTTKEIINEVPYVQTVKLPNHWFDELKDSKSVFISLYEWMLENGRVPVENKNTLPSRTYVGEKLFSRLLNTEKKRLKKILKIKGAELDSAVFWSDCDSGPKTEIGGCKISGDVILVIPQSSKQALGEFTSKIYKKECEAAINKNKANAAGATFYGWLISQIDRPDRVGDIARDVEGDEWFPRESNQYEGIKSYLWSQGASDKAIESLKEGWLEYLKQYPERVQKYAWCSACGKRLDVNDALLAWDSASEELFVADKACLSKFIQFDEIFTRPLSSVTYDDLEEFAEKDEISERDIDDLIKSLKLWGVMPVTIEGYVYFISSKKNLEIKIGFTAGQVEKRLKSLQTAHPYKLQLITKIPGTPEYEKSLHERFSKFRLEGEWFKSDPDLLAFIAVIIKGQSGTTSR
jgi:uncharacterized protein YozE (UPF0346 family)